MICTRCGTEQRRETARFCHQCGGTTFAPSPTNVQPDLNELPVSEAAEAAPEDIPTLNTVTYNPPEPDMFMPQERAPEQPRYPPQPARNYPNWHDEAPTALPEDPPTRPAPPDHAPVFAAPPAWDAPPRREPAAPPYSRQPDGFAPMATNQAFAPENRPMSSEPPARGARPAPPTWAQEPPAWERQTPPAFPADEEPVVVRARGVPPAQHHVQSHPNQASFEGRGEPPIAWQTPPAEPPSRSAARGPVPGGLQRPRPAPKRRRVPLGVIITLALLLVFVIAGAAIYVFASGSASQEPAAFLSYSDPGHHFSIHYPNVWTVKQTANGARFVDATNTAELSVTYTSNTANLTAAQFADQEAAAENISTPDSQTFAGATWVERSGIVTQTSGISQDIFIFVTVSNNFLYEVREVAPLDGYKEPNQAAFMPMLQSLSLT